MVSTAMPKRRASDRPRRRIVCRLQEMMDERSLTQTQVAVGTGLALSTVGIYCRSQFVRIDILTAEALCEFLHCNMCDLFPLVDKGDDRR